MSNVDWAALEAMQAAGMTQADVEALANQGTSPTCTSTQGGTVTGLDSNGLPEAPGAAGASSPLVPSLPPNATQAQMIQAAMQEYNSNPQLQQWVSQTYGYIGAYMLQQPELLPILVAAGLENWDQAQFDGAITQTQWWKNTSQAQRNYQNLLATDPGEAAAQVSQMQNTILTQAQGIGVTLSSSDLKNMAQMAVTFGWSSDTITQTLRAGQSQNVGYQGIPTFGEAATFSQQMTQLAGEYNQQLSPKEMEAYIQQNVQGKLTADGLQSLFAIRAGQQMPWMADSIAKGVTPSQYLSSYASAAGQTLDIDPSDVNWSDPKWFRALLNTDPSGNQTPNSIAGFQQALMKDPTYGFQNTKNARDLDYGAAQQILQTFGKVAG